jgi:hypothetical protein
VRLVGAFAVVGALLVVTLYAYTRLVRRAGASSARARVRARMRRPRTGWLARLMPARAPDIDRIEILARSYVGSRESISVVKVGRERFLVGITGTTVSFLSRLDANAPGARILSAAAGPRALGAESGDGAERPDGWAAAPAEPAATDFAAFTDFGHALRAAATPVTGAPAASMTDDTAERAIRAALARSRERLGRLDTSLVSAGELRG